MSGAKDVPGGHESHRYIADFERFAIDRVLAVLRAIAGGHDRQRFRRRQHRAMPASGVVGMAVRDPRPRLGQRRIDPRVGGTHVNALRVGFDPGTETCHRTLMTAEPAMSFPWSKR